MSWFKVDDGLHDHRKARHVRRSHPDKRRDVAPFGLWVTAGSWAGGSGTKGFVPTEIIEEWDDDALELAARLVAADLWWETEQDGEPGFGFHDWQDYVPRMDGIEDSSESGRRGNHLRWHEKRSQFVATCEFCTGNRPDIGGDDRPDIANASGANREPVPTRPDPTHTPASADAERPSVGVAAEFAEFWATYPKRKDKGHALTAFKAARKKASLEQILDGLRRQLPKLMQSEERYRPYAATWLRGERWTDEAEQSSVTPLRPVAEIPQAPDGMTDEQYRAWYIENHGGAR